MANLFRHGLFNCFFDDEPVLRSSALRILGLVVDHWTSAWQDFLRTSSGSSMSPRLTRPPLARQQSNGSAASPAPPSSRNLIRRDSSFKMQFEDVFGLDGEDLSTLDHLGRKDSIYNSFLPLTPERDDGWTTLSGDFAVSPTDASGSFADGAVRFGNKWLAELDFANRDLAWTGRQVAEETWGVEEMKTNLENFYTWLLRFSIDCPFKDVRKGCRAILQRAEKAGARLPEVPVRGPSFFIPLNETIGLNFGPWTPATPNPKSPTSFDIPSEDEEDCISFSPREPNGNMSSASGIMIPDPNKGSANGERPRSTSRGRAPIGSFGRGNRRTTVSMVSSLFQTPPSPPNGVSASYKVKRRQARQPIPKYLPKPKSPTEEVRALQVSAYMRTGRVGNLNKILFFFPHFAEINRETTDLFLSDDSGNGPLPQRWRIYLGIISSAEKKCQYYLSLLSEKFLTVRGDRQWLKGLQYTPPKLQRISKLNMLLAHRPWTITPDDIKELVRGEEGGNMDPEQRWTMAEVVQAICIMSFYHSKSAMALAWAILPEADLLGGTVKTMEKCTPVAPFGSLAATSISTDPSENSGFVKRDEESSKTGVCRKRQQVAEGQEPVELPEKWRKTPNGGIPFIPESASPTSPLLSPSKPVDVPVASLRKAQTTLGTMEERERHHHRTKSQKRRKSFEECAASDDAPPPTTGLGGFSLSAPNSYVPFSSLSNGRPLPAQARDFLLSPSSSTSSLFDTSLLGDQVPANIIVEDYARFLHPESLDHEHKDFDPNSCEYEFLPMEEFEWERNASSIISDYLDGVVELLDRYFKEAQEADGEEDTLFSAAVETLLPRKRLNDELSPGRGDDGSLRAPGDGEYYDLDSNTNHNLTERHDRAGRSFNSSGRSASSPPRYVFEPQSFKEAAWFYSLRLLGIQKDDFRYSEIKVLLDKGARRYLKRICAQPDMVSLADWAGVGQGLGGLKCEEKCLLSLLACQAQFMGEMLWGIRAVSEYIG
ncbi:PA26-domain-containing protein [Choiromyces venosus 120613-1]|uniref:PA26-domain-containing protein n=1 Tax=Choiromyces venosus 120613-1 TaxID=1336337 RepID=A0A3N4JGT0_9PEZI|nr:PA26-domain-containing protein [Choiromyces venosus 120613-1]